jgi:C4-dicarboxylate transporter DctM subunit
MAIIKKIVSAFKEIVSIFKESITVLSEFYSYFWQRFENITAYAAIFLLALFPTMEVVARKFFHTGVPESYGYTHHLVLIVTFIGGMITSREKKHLSLSLNLKIKEPLKSRIQIVNAIISSMIAFAFSLCSYSFALVGFDPGKKIGPIPMPLLVMVMSLGFAVMAFRFANAAPAKGKAKFIAWLGIPLGCFLAYDPLLNILTHFYGELPAFFTSIREFYHSVNGIIAYPLIILLVVSAIFGARIFIILGGIAYMLFARNAQPLEIISNEAYAMLISHTIPAIPLFTVTGFLLSESKAGERLVRLFKSLFSWFPGGLAIMAILVCTFFTTFTGASGVTILALGGLLSFVLIQGKYKKKFSVGLLTASGSIGLLFPPSLPIIIYAVTAQISVKDMFIGGIVPGFVMVLALVIFGIIYAVKTQPAREPFNFKEIFAGIKESIWEIFLPVIILLVYFGGLATLEESAAIALLYTLIVEVFINRDLKISDLPRVLLKCIPVIGGVLVILALAKGLSYFMVDAEIPMQLTAWMKANIGSKYVFLLLLNIALLITGCFMDIFSAILVVVPLILPLGNVFGVNPVHLGIIFLANMELGYLTPPVGLNLFLASYRFEQPMVNIYRSVLPFFFIQLATVLLITYLPVLSTGLLGLLGK